MNYLQKTYKIWMRDPAYRDMTKAVASAISFKDVIDTLNELESLRAENERLTDRELIGQLIYMAMYKDQGSIWSANEHKEVWYKKADWLIDNALKDLNNE